MEEIKGGDRSATDKMSAKGGDSERLSSTFSEAAAEDTTTKGEASADKTD